MKEIKNSDLRVVKTCLDSLVNTDIDTANVLKCVKLRREVKEAIEDLGESQEAILKKHGIDVKEKDYHKDEKFPDAEKELVELDSGKIELKNSRFMSEEVLLKNVEKMSIAQIDILMDVLLSDDEEIKKPKKGGKPE